jgi:hypothetical protein
VACGALWSGLVSPARLSVRRLKSALTFGAWLEISRGHSSRIRVLCGRSSSSSSSSRQSAAAAAAKREEDRTQSSKQPAMHCSREENRHHCSTTELFPCKWAGDHDSFQRAGGVHMLPLRTSLRGAGGRRRRSSSSSRTTRTTGGTRQIDGRANHAAVACFASIRCARALYTWRSGNNNHCR